MFSPIQIRVVAVLSALLASISVLLALRILEYARVTDAGRPQVQSTSKQYSKYIGFAETNSSTDQHLPPKRSKETTFHRLSPLIFLAP